MPQEICHTLPAIVSPDSLDDPRQQWMVSADGKAFVLVGSMMSAAEAEGYPAPSDELFTMDGRMPWVTLPYDLADHLLKRLPVCSDSLECRMRLVQLLGLPPACDYDCITFFYAEADGLFRPTTDHETTDHEAELDFPASATPDYREWFEDNKQFSYFSDTPYPWTRLGYTYDWHCGTSSHVGPGEFIIREGATVSSEKKNIDGNPIGEIVAIMYRNILPDKEWEHSIATMIPTAYKDEDGEPIDHVTNPDKQLAHKALGDYGPLGVKVSNDDFLQ